MPPQGKLFAKRWVELVDCEQSPSCLRLPTHAFIPQPCQPILRWRSHCQRKSGPKFWIPNTEAGNICIEKYDKIREGFHGLFFLPGYSSCYSNMPTSIPILWNIFMAFCCATGKKKKSVTLSGMVCRKSTEQIELLILIQGASIKTKLGVEAAAWLSLHLEWPSGGKFSLPSPARRRLPRNVAVCRAELPTTEICCTFHHQKSPLDGNVSCIPAPFPHPPNLLSLSEDFRAPTPSAASLSAINSYVIVSQVTVHSTCEMQEMWWQLPRLPKQGMLSETKHSIPSPRLLK